MEKKERGFKTIAVVALCVALVALSVAYAGYTSTLTVEGTATVKSAWDIKWTDLSAGTKTGYADISNKSLAILTATLTWRTKPPLPNEKDGWYLPVLDAGIS